MNKKNLAFKRYSDFYIKYPLHVTKKVINGAGPQGKGKFIRDTLFYKFSVTEAANMHDFLYSEYAPKQIVRKDADDLFLEMMLRKLKTHSVASRIINKPLVYVYYFAVRVFGKSFWTKEKIEW